MKTINMENRAWHGTRCVTDNIIVDNQEIAFEVHYHYVKKQYLTETYIRNIDTGACIGKFEFPTTETPEEQIEFIEKKYNVKIIPINDLILKAY